MIELGKIQTLKIAREKDFGVYLADEEGASVLLPKKQVPNGKNIGDDIEVFVYKDSRDRLIATTKKPLISVGEIAKVLVKDVTNIGAFVDIGLERDVLLPYHEMRYELKKGDTIEVYLYVDHSQRLAATMYTKKHEDATVIKNDKIKTYFYEQNADEVLTILKEKFDGHVPYTDKTVQPDEIQRDFGMSKAAFKRAVGKLLKEGKIKITKTSIFCLY
ncbi:RNA-binding protein [Oribacterium sp. C9]|uniref:S1-like domain-containing RNA-binding protein n=1 Tax=Oribacterium sp. C9 TaxID=1943579 RepID=UPI00098FCA2D|nr:S1-like domain-containing RNA-binding protein [Oribacterium sp. C9]OON85836.1 RNA-binding protein [Oribacterium sp. C9]